MRATLLRRGVHRAETATYIQMTLGGRLAAAEILRDISHPVSRNELRLLTHVYAASKWIPSVSSCALFHDKLVLGLSAQAHYLCEPISLRHPPHGTFSTSQFSHRLKSQRRAGRQLSSLLEYPAQAFTFTPSYLGASRHPHQQAFDTQQTLGSAHTSSPLNKTKQAMRPRHSTSRAFWSAITSVRAISSTL